MIKLIIIVCVISLISFTYARVLETDSWTQRSEDQVNLNNDGGNGTRWAVLMAGSNKIWNYRHQADVCHAYQLLKRGGLKDENIITMMYDDIAYNDRNIYKKGAIINRPGGPDLYAGVLKDYTGDAVSAANFYAILQGNSSAIEGGNRKVLDSGPDDHVFIYYTDHGSPGIIATPGDGEYIYADKLNAILREMHDKKRFKSMVFYVEACESGSIFEGLLQDNLNIYAMTAANSTEPSVATYCEEFECLGDLFSVSWMEDVENHNRSNETIKEEYKIVKNRTLAGSDI